ncbi:hypothetical protein SOCE26_106350 [Sorangium cellulosum]|uniref:Uncharacterized protein n=1 Tax=Sorangium cellulosum TaxID=56 RepID=A0A2L0FBX3_SORCE|nr:hypothetical protein [Sorangium cellulosum]AUX49090.1 hypothetical protein SOCE26_106350 [Sorangium cellulosum]
MVAFLRASLRTLLLVGTWALVGCGEQTRTTAAEDARRVPVLLQFDGYLYVPAETSNFKILERVRAQTLSVFTGLRKSRIMVSRREVKGANVESFTREAVTVVDAATGRRDLALRVRYRYVARPEVANGIDARKELALALLHRQDDVIAERVLRECTANPDQSKRSSSAIAIDFDASLPRCKAAVDAEQAEIDAARAQVPELAGGSPDPARDTVVTVEEVRRVYIPTRVTVEPRPRQPGEVAPRYVPPDRPEVAQAAPGPETDAAERLAEVARNTVIVDPDHKVDMSKTPEEQALAAEGALLPKMAAASDSDSRRLPAVVSAGEAQAQRKVADPPNEKIEIPFETLADPKFLVVWLSLLMAYPILRGDPRGRKRG